MRFTLKGSRDHHYLKKVTDFMIACRREDPLGGMWDAGDLQWWWRENLYGDPENQMFFEDHDGKTVGVILTSKEYRCLDYEILPHLGQEKSAQEIFEWGLSRLCNLADNDSSGVTLMIRHDHERFREMAECEGFVPTDATYVQTALELATPPAPVQLSEGYAVRSIRPKDLTEEKPPVLCITAEMFRRIRQSSLYNGDMHLVVALPDGRAAAECICWVDRVNGIGIFEPVRTHDQYQRRGLGRALMTEGLQRMTVCGVRLAKVSYAATNESAAALYVNTMGFSRIFDRISYRYEGVAGTI